MINDGFGDNPEYQSLTREEVLNSVLPDRMRWIRTVAWNMLGSTRSDEHDDLCQEGLIAMWKAVDTFSAAADVPLESWLQMHARYRMLDVRNGARPLTGEEKSKDQPTGDVRGEAARTKIKDFLRTHPKATGQEIAAGTGMSASTVSYHRKRLGIDVPPPTYTSLEALLDEGFNPALAGDVLDQVVQAYHQGEILQALNVLTPAERKYVVLRFWKGLEAQELKQAFGYPPHALWRTAKQRLGPVLQHLVAL